MTEALPLIATTGTMARFGMLGLTGGISHLAANLADIITPRAIGAIVAATGSFFFALAYVGCLALVGALSYIFVLGDVERITLQESR